MKRHNTQKLFWKRWPYKVILELQPAKEFTGWRVSRETSQKRSADAEVIKKWCNSMFDDCGIRKESNLSVFLSNADDLKTLLDSWGHRVTAVWEPANDSAKDLLLQHSYDVVRTRPWYGKFPIRARILYNSDFKDNVASMFKTAVNSIDENDWHAAGLLKTIIDTGKTPRIYGWGQPLHLYLASNEDAIMLRLQCGDYIERFEKIRAP